MSRSGISLREGSTRSCGCSTEELRLKSRGHFPRSDGEIKQCRRCLKYKPMRQFPLNSRDSDGHHSYCRRCCNEYAKEYRASRKAKGLPSLQTLKNRQLRIEVLSHYSGSGRPKCACCGEDHLEFLALDHTNGDGAKQRRELANGKRGQNGAVYRWVKKHNFPLGYRVLCHNCNSAHGYYGYCPHDRERQDAGKQIRSTRRSKTDVIQIEEAMRISDYQSRHATTIPAVNTKMAA